MHHHLKNALHSGFCFISCKLYSLSHHGLVLDLREVLLRSLCICCLWADWPKGLVLSLPSVLGLLCPRMHILRSYLLALLKVCLCDLPVVLSARNSSLTSALTPDLAGR